jgi:hypothetical protein
MSVNGSVYGSTLYEYRDTEIELPILSKQFSQKSKLTAFYRHVRNYGYFICQIWDNDTTEELPFYAVYDSESIGYKKEKSQIYPFSTKIKIREVK